MRKSSNNYDYMSAVAQRFNIREKEIKSEHLLLYIVDEFLKNLNNENKGLSLFGNDHRLYNGMYWEIIEPEKLKRELGRFALELGLPESKAKHYEFRDKLIKELNGLCDTNEPIEANKITKINLQNGTLWIDDSGIEMKTFQKNDYLTYQLPFDYNPKAECSIFQSFLDTVLPEKDLQLISGEFYGSVFDLGFKHEKVLLNYGQGANGKSVMFEIITALLGKYNVCSYSLSNLTNSAGSYRYNLDKYLLNYSSELTGNLEAAAFKQLASGEPIEAKRLYKDPVIIYDYARLSFNCNVLPQAKERTNGFFRRFLLVPYSVTIPSDKQDKSLANKIIEKELSGVFNWLLDGLKRLKNNGAFTTCSACEKELNQYINQSDSVGLFMEECYEHCETQKERLKNLYIEYAEFCDDGGYRNVNKANFRNRLEVLGYKVPRRSSGYVVACTRKRYNISECDSSISEEHMVNHSVNWESPF